MVSNEELISRQMESMSDRIVEELRSSIAKTVEHEVQRNVTRALVEGEFFRHLSSEMQSGLKQIYHEVTHAQKANFGLNTANARQETGELFNEASDQLDQILQTTEQATVDIMEVVEKHLESQMLVRTLLQDIKNGKADGQTVDSLIEASQVLDQDLLKIMTLLSFQDLTGQRIKMIIEALRKVQTITFDLFVSTGLKIKAKEQDPDKDIGQLEQETKQKVSELKGPQAESSQCDVDDLLAQLGVE